MTMAPTKTYTYDGTTHFATDTEVRREDGTTGTLYVAAEDNKSLVIYADGWRWFPGSKATWLNPIFG